MTRRKLPHERTPRMTNLVGRKFGLLTVTGWLPVAERNSPNYAHVCTCECGGTKHSSTADLNNGTTWHCGCTGGAVARSRHPLWHTWWNMVQRCHDRNHEAYPRYGGRGIAVCASWRQDFWNFANDMGNKPSPELSLERKDNSARYTKDNCTWATASEQALNRNPKGTFS
jgi:hypothetical protein